VTIEDHVVAPLLELKFPNFSFSDFSRVGSHLRKNNNIKKITSMKHFIYAERMGEWSQHLKCICNIIPYFLSCGHFQYAKAAYLYLQVMLEIKNILSGEDYLKFTKMYFTVRRTDEFFSGLWSDMVIEQTLISPTPPWASPTGGQNVLWGTQFQFSQFFLKVVLVKISRDRNIIPYKISDQMTLNM